MFKCIFSSKRTYLRCFRMSQLCIGTLNGAHATTQAYLASQRYLLYLTTLKLYPVPLNPAFPLNIICDFYLLTLILI